MTIARVPDCVELLPFNQVCEAFNRYNEAATGVGLVRLYQSNEIFPDIYFQYYGEHFTIMGLSDPEIRFGMADEFVGGYLVRRHVTASGWRVQAMLPPSYMLAATHPVPSSTYMYRPGGTGTPGQHLPIHDIFLAPKGQFIMSPGRFRLMMPQCPGSCQRATATPRGLHWTSRVKTAKMRKMRQGIWSRSSYRFQECWGHSQQGG